MNVKLYDSELKVIDVLWRKGEMPAKDIAKILECEIGWNKNTTYTVIKKCIAKGAIERKEPKFICKALISREEVQKYETNELIERVFDGSKIKLFASFIDNEELSKEEWEEIMQIINRKN